MRKILKITCLFALCTGLTIGCGEDDVNPNDQQGDGNKGDGDSGDGDSGDGDSGDGDSGDGDSGDGDSGDGDSGDGDSGDGDSGDGDSGDGDSSGAGKDCIFDETNCLTGPGVADICEDDLDGTLGTCSKSDVEGTCVFEEGGEDVTLYYYKDGSDPWSGLGGNAEEDCVDFWEGKYTAK